MSESDPHAFGEEPSMPVVDVRTPGGFASARPPAVSSGLHGWQTAGGEVAAEAAAMRSPDPDAALQQLAHGLA